LTRARLNNIGFHRQAKIIGFRKEIFFLKCPHQVAKNMFTACEFS